MKKSLLIVVLLCAFLAFPLAAFEDIGVGVIVGDPTGVSLLVDEKIAAGAAWDISKHLHLHGDYWLIKQSLKEPLNWYMGLGAKFLLFNADSRSGPSWESDEESPDGSVGLGARIPFGLQWYAMPELEVFGELVPALMVFPATEFDIDAGIGIRYHF